MQLVFVYFMIFVNNSVMSYVFYDTFSVLNFLFMDCNSIIFTIKKCEDYKTKAFPMTCVYYCLKIPSTHL